MITNKDIRVENGFLIINGNKYPLDGQSPETIMQIVEDNSDTTPTENSDAPITSGGVFTALAGKQDTLTFDTAPTDESTNPVTSGGLYNTIGDLTQTGITGADVATQLESLNDDLVLERFTPTLAAAIGTPNNFEHNCFYNPKTKQVHIQVMIYSADALIPTNSGTIFTVDQKYRPASNLQIGMAMLISSDNWETKAMQMEKCFMGANGAFGLNNFIYGPKATKIVFIEADYIAA